MKNTKNNTSQQSGDKIWDRTFKTMLQNHPSLFIALVNLVFNKKYKKDVSITNLNTETYIEDGSKIMSDLAFLIENRTYHFECQFTNDGTMAFRMFEYDFHLALADAKRSINFSEFTFPKSCVFYIVPKEDMPKSLSMKINFQNGSYNYEVPVVRLFDYDLDKIEEKELFLFLPYEILRHIRNVKTEKHIKEYADEIESLYSRIINILESAYNKQLTREEILTLLSLISETAEYKLKNNYIELWEGVDKMLNKEFLPKWKIKLEQELEKERNKVIKETEINYAIKTIKTFKKSGCPEEHIKYFAKENHISSEMLEQILKEDTKKSAQA